MLLEFDLAGAEWHIVSMLCRDPAMLEITRTGKSPHNVTAVRMFNATPEMIKLEESLNGKLREPEIISANRLKVPGLLDIAASLPRTMSLRQAAKKSAHGLNYGEQYLTFAIQNEVENSEARKLVDLYHKAYPGIQQWHKSIRFELEKNRTLTNFFGRKCYFMGNIDNDMFKQGYAFKPQSTVVDIVDKAMPMVLEDESPEFEEASLYAQVHDSLLTDHRSKDFELMAKFAIKVGIDYMRPTLNYGEDFVLGTTMKAGFDWGHMHEVENFSTDINKLAAELEKIHKGFFDKKSV
jgi:DNA polymerase I-like protein with 3'-5' exonuclease and polymerase domains